MCSSVRQPRTTLRAGSDDSVRPPPDRSASFHGRASVVPPERRQIRRLKTQSDLLALGRNGEGATVVAATATEMGERRVPPKVLVNVSVQGNLRPVQVMADADWTVGDLVTAAVRAYAKEGRRPALPAEGPAAFGLHYSQFSLECLDPKEKVMELGLRRFFLCPIHVSASEITGGNGGGAAPGAASSSSAAGSCSKPAEKDSKINDDITWFNFMEFLL